MVSKADTSKVREAGQLTAADKTLIVLQAAIGNRRFSDIVQETGFAKATVHRLLRTLLNYGFVVVTDDGEYIAGPEALRLAALAFNEIDISKIAAPFIAELSAETGYTVHVGALNRYEAVYVAKSAGSAPYLIPSGIGERLHLHSTSIGKCLLAGMTPSEAEAAISGSGLVPRTPNTITTMAALREELRRVVAKGYSIDDEENVPGLRCVGAPIVDHSGRVAFGVSMTSLAMENSLAAVENYAEAVVATADKISRALGADRVGF